MPSILEVRTRPAIALTQTLVSSHGDLVPRGRFGLHSRFADCLNFGDRERLVSLVREGAGPFHVRLVPFPCSASRVVVGDDWMEVDGERLALEPAARHASAPVLEFPVPREALGARVRLLRSLLRVMSPARSVPVLLEGTPLTALEQALAERVRRGVDLLAEGRLAAAASTLRGAGFGLTPSGDDFLCGVMAATHLAERVRAVVMCEERETLYRVAVGENAVSNACLRAARAGRLSQSLKQVMEALWTGAALEASASALLACGETSGADTAAGLVEGLDYWLGTRRFDWGRMAW